VWDVGWGAREKRERTRGMEGRGEVEVMEEIREVMKIVSGLKNLFD
tara:strand:- start:432 stop:569 length:138 start_codon:yes stop_codon:yes gene_type:complete